MVDRGPQSVNERDEKIAQLSGQINGFFGDEGPDVIGLAEVGPEAIFDAIRGLLNGSFLSPWEAPGMATQTGIGLLARMPPCADIELVDTQRPTTAARPQIVLARVSLTAVDEPFLVAVNHWKSRMQTGGVDSA